MLAAAPPGRGAGRGVSWRACARARRNGRDLLLPVVRHAGGGWGVAALEPEQPLAPGRRVLTLLPGPRPVLVQRRRASLQHRWPRSAPPAWTRSSSRGGAEARRKTRGCRSSSPLRAGSGSSSASTSSRTAGARPRPWRGSLLHREPRRSRRLRVPPDRLRAVGLGIAPTAVAPDATAARRDGPGRFCRGRPLRRRLHVRLQHLRRRQVRTTLRAGTCDAPGLLTECGPRVQRTAGRRGRREPRTPARRNLRPSLERCARGSAGHRLDHELQRVGRGHADRARPGPPRLRLLRRRVGAFRPTPPRRPISRAPPTGLRGSTRFHSRDAPS